MTKPILMKTMKRIVLGLIAVGVLAGMFWYINTYIYKFYASNPTVGIDSTSTVAEVTTGSTFNVSTILSTQKVASADLVITFDKDKVAFQDTVTSVPPNYFKMEYKKLSDGTTNQSKLRLILIGETTALNSVQLNLSFKALKSGTATIAVTSDSVIAGVDATNRAIIFDEDLTKASKQITIKEGSSLIAHWKMDDNVSGNGKTIDDFVSTNNATTVIGGNNTGMDCTTAGKKDKSCSFDGVDDFLRGTTSLTFGTKASITGWIKTAYADGAIFGIVSPSYSNSLALRINGGKLQGLTDYSANWPNNAVTSTKNVNDNQWHYVAFVVEDLNGYLYVDGELNGTDTMASSAGFTDNSWSIGYSDASWSPAYYAGQIDDLKLYNVALTADQIRTEAGITPTVTPILTTSPSVTIQPSVTPTSNPTVTVSPTVEVSPSVSPTPTPPWQNTNYNTTTFYGVVQEVDESGAGIAGKYWRKDATVCANATYSNYPFSINGNFVDQCTGFNNIPYFSEVITSDFSRTALIGPSMPEGYECAGWEYRLRIKSDGRPLTVASGSGCATNFLNLTINNASSTYENSHFFIFKIKRRDATPTPTSPLEQFESALNMKVKLQGIQTAPREQYRKININIVLKGGGQTVKEQVVEFSAQQDGTWTGALGVDGINAATKYELILKGAKHLAKKICVSNPSEQLGGTYRCTDANITLQKGANDLDFSKIILLGGDLPAQDGLINALDFAFIRQNLGSQDPENLIRGDINLDGIIDTQDHTALKTALDFKYDEE